MIPPSPGCFWMYLNRRIGLLLLLCGSIGSAMAGTGTGQDWLMLVRTENADPAREAEFNHWYDEIDIPDVFTVPGYQRARRGQLEPGGGPASGEGRYVALYDIRSSDIEATIEAMNTLAREMPQKGRATPLLRVTERVYYAARGASRTGTPATAPGQRWLLLERFDLADGAADWYAERVFAAALAVPGVLRGARYRLHRVRMDVPVPMPAELSVWEIEARDAAAAAALLGQVLEEARGASPAGAGYRAHDRNVFLQIKDVARPVREGDGGSKN